MDFGFVVTALLAIAFGALISRFARDKLKRSSDKDSIKPVDLQGPDDAKS